MGLQGYSAEIKVFETLFGADENSQREATMTCTGQTFHQEVKEVESWGLRLLAVFRVYFEFRNVLRTILYSLPWWEKGGGYLGITWFSDRTTGDHLFPRVYGADYRMWLLLLTSTIIRTLQSLMGVGGRSGKFYRDSSKILRSSLLHVNSCKLLYNSSTITV